MRQAIFRGKISKLTVAEKNSECWLVFEKSILLKLLRTLQLNGVLDRKKSQNKKAPLCNGVPIREFQFNAKV